MRKNLSEALENIEINDVITLDDGSEKKPEEEKEAEKLEDAIQKELDEKNKIADEIREAEAPKAEANDGYGKSVKIKQFVEKLNLSEEDCDNVLNEDFDENEFILRSDCVHKIYSVMEEYAMNILGEDAPITYEIVNDIEAMCDEALVHFEDAHSNDLF